MHAWQHRLLHSGDLTRKAQKNVGADGLTFLLFRFEVGVYDLVTQTICAPGFLGIGPVFPSICFEAGILEDVTQRGLFKETYKVTGFDGILDAQEAFEVACICTPVAENDVKVGQQEIVEDVWCLGFHQLRKLAAVRGENGVQGNAEPLRRDYGGKGRKTEPRPERFSDPWETHHKQLECLCLLFGIEEDLRGVKGTKLRVKTLLLVFRIRLVGLDLEGRSLFHLQ